MCVEEEFSQDPIFASPGSNIVDGSEARVATMSEYDVQMASTGSANEAPGDYSKRMRDKKIMLAQYPGPDAKRFYSWTNGPLAKHLANKDAPDKMPDVVMDLSYALDHKPGEVIKLKYAENDPLENKIADSGENIYTSIFETPKLKFSTPDKRGRPTCSTAYT